MPRLPRRFDAWRVLVALVLGGGCAGPTAPRASLVAAAPPRPVASAALEVEPRVASLLSAATPESSPVAVVAAVTDVASSPTPAGATPPDPIDPLDATVRPDLGGGMVLAGASGHRMVLFTFDDGPHPWHTRRLLEHLSRAEVRGVFFVNAHRFDASTGWYAECAAVLRETAAAGHVIGNHGRDHELTARLEGAALDAQIVGAEDIFLRVLGARPWLFRPPGGVRSAATDAYLSARGYTQMLWTLHTGDYETDDPDTVLRNFRGSILAREGTSTPGGIAVIHDSHPWGVEAFPRMVRFLRRRNCELLERGEELYEIVADPALFFVSRTAGEGPSALAPAIRLPPDVAATRQAALYERERARCDADSGD